MVSVGLHGRAAGELAAVRDEQVLDVVGLAELVDHAVPRFSHSCRSVPMLCVDGYGVSPDKFSSPSPRRPRTTAEPCL